MEKSLFTSDYRAVCRLLREKREAAGLTQVEMAERLDETQSYVSKCERGDRRVDLVQLRQFCRAMGLSLLDFVGEFERQTGKGKPSRE
jgi:transcriptional regulator with XRE-family HTH domain